ncbi:hypothetical protein ACFQ0M_16835 [Kitasatospora aburaviensis]
MELAELSPFAPAAQQRPTPRAVSPPSGVVAAPALPGVPAEPVVLVIPAAPVRSP